MAPPPALEWANAKCRWAAYFGYWPDWVDLVTIPGLADVDLLLRQFNVKLARGDFEGVKRRARLDDPRAAPRSPMNPAA